MKQQPGEKQIRVQPNSSSNEVAAIGTAAEGAVVTVAVAMGSQPMEQQL